MPLTLTKAEREALDQVFMNKAPTAAGETINGLLSRGMIVRTGDKYCLTPKGRLALAPIGGQKASESDAI